MNDRDCESCKMHEFTLHSATKYKDGTPIMSNQLDPEFCEFGTCPYYDKFCDHTLHDKHGCAYLPHTPEADLKYLEQTFTEFAKTQDDLIEEYDATLKTHGDTLEQHMERITISEGNIDAISADVEDLQKKVYQIHQFLNSVDPDFFAKIEEQVRLEKLTNNGSNFCGNCTHFEVVEGIGNCELSGEIVDPDDSSCSMFEPPF